MINLTLLKLLVSSFLLGSVCDPDNFDFVCTTPVGLQIFDDHINGCHGARYIQVTNVTSDSITLYVKDSVVINSFEGNITIELPCH